MMIKNLGMRVENIWKDLRPMTKKMLAGELKTAAKKRKQNFSYDVHADWEISRLLTALDEQSVKSKTAKNTGKLKEINHLAEVCAYVMEAETKSAEIFIQLVERALSRNKYKKIDELSDILLERFSASEIAEIIRQTEKAPIQAIAYETLAVSPVSSITPLIRDPLYFEIACNVLDQQANEFENEEARATLERLSSNFKFGID